MAQRHYATMSADAHTLSFDPRFAVFEYVYDIMLRRRQVRDCQQVRVCCTVVA